MLYKALTSNMYAMYLSVFHLKHWQSTSLKLQFVPQQSCTSNKPKICFSYSHFTFQSYQNLLPFWLINIMCPSFLCVCVCVTVIFGYCITEVSEVIRMIFRSSSLQYHNLLSDVSIIAHFALSYIKWIRMFMPPFSWTLIWMLAWNLMPFIITYWNVPEASLPSVVMVSVTVQC